jgi:hypothetical protein
VDVESNNKITAQHSPYRMLRDVHPSPATPAPRSRVRRSHGGETLRRHVVKPFAWLGVGSVKVALSRTTDQMVNPTVSPPTNKLVL